MKRAQPLLITSILIATLFNSSAGAADSKPTLPLTTPGTFALGVCKNDQATDCIVSVSSVTPSGESIGGKLIEDITFPQLQDGPNTRIDGVSIWDVQSESSTEQVRLRVDLETPARIIAPNQTGSALRVLVENSAQISATVKIVVRTSWLKPQNVQLVAENANFSERKVANSREWTFIGSTTTVSNYFDWLTASKNNFMDKADVDTSALHFYIHHVGASDSASYFPITCADKGYTVQAWNSSAAGTPYWDKATSSLNFGVQAPHLKASGEQNKGFFTLWAPEEFIACRWPENTLIGAARITIEVLNPDGTQQIALTSVMQRNKTLYFSASGFHYSSPTIRVIGQKPVEAAPVQKPIETAVASKPATEVAKKRTITCSKGKTTKKFTAVKPQCPSGWKEK